MSVLRIGILGAGRIGKVHAENITRFVKGVEIVGIADPLIDRKTTEWANGLGIKVVTKDSMQLINNPEIDAIMVCSSTDTHADFIMAAANAKKHVFCEKPIDLSVLKGKEAIETAKDKGVKLQLGFNRRFDHNFKRIRELTEDGSIGDVHLIKITSRDPAPPSAAYAAVSGGIFLDMMIHDFDMARYQAGCEVVSVDAHGAVLIDPEIGKAGDVDTAIVTLVFENGALGVIDNSRKAVYGYDQRVEVFGSKGCAIAANDQPNRVTLFGGENVSQDKPLYFFLERYKDAFVDEVAAFVEAIRTDGEVPVDGTDGLEAMVVALAAGKSLKEGRRVTIAEMKKELGL